MIQRRYCHSAVWTSEPVPAFAPGEYVAKRQGCETRLKYRAGNTQKTGTVIFQRAATDMNAGLTQSVSIDCAPGTLRRQRGATESSARRKSACRAPAAVRPPRRPQVRLTQEHSRGGLDDLVGADTRDKTARRARPLSDAAGECVGVAAYPTTSVEKAHAMQATRCGRECCSLPHPEWDQHCFSGALRTRPRSHHPVRAGGLDDVPGGPDHRLGRIQVDRVVLIQSFDNQPQWENELE